MTATHTKEWMKFNGGLVSIVKEMWNGREGVATHIWTGLQGSKPTPGHKSS